MEQGWLWLRLTHIGLQCIIHWVHLMLISPFDRFKHNPIQPNEHRDIEQLESFIRDAYSSSSDGITLLFRVDHNSNQDLDPNYYYASDSQFPSSRHIRGP